MSPNKPLLSESAAKAACFDVQAADQTHGSLKAEPAEAAPQGHPGEGGEGAAAHTQQQQDQRHAGDAATGDGGSMPGPAMGM